jgi:hypothetical protein
VIKAGLEFRIGNRRVSQRDFVKNIEPQMVEQAKTSILRKAKSVIDPKTGRPPKIRFARGKPLDFEIVGSKEAIARVRAKLR